MFEVEAGGVADVSSGHFEVGCGACWVDDPVKAMNCVTCSSVKAVGCEGGEDMVVVVVCVCV